MKRRPFIQLIFYGLLFIDDLIHSDDFFNKNPCDYEKDDVFGRCGMEPDDDGMREAA